jgi:antitoxin PrlF
MEYVMGAYTTMTSKGQLTIPKDVRDELALTPGTKFYVSVRNGEVVALPKNKRIADLAGILGKPPAGAGATLEDFDEAIGQAIAEDDERIVREWNERYGKKG